MGNVQTEKASGTVARMARGVIKALISLRRAPVMRSSPVVEMRASTAQMRERLVSDISSGHQNATPLETGVGPYSGLLANHMASAVA